MFLSSTSSVVLLIVVVVPSTCRSPAITTVPVLSPTAAVDGERSRPSKVAANRRVAGDVDVTGAGDVVRVQVEVAAKLLSV